MLYVMFRYHGESLQSIRKALLRALNLRAEPQLPAGGLDAIRAQWQSTFSNILHRAKNAAGKWNTKFIETHGFFKVKRVSKVSIALLFPRYSSCTTLCVSCRWKQFEPEVLPQGLWDLHDRYLCVLLCILYVYPYQHALIYEKYSNPCKYAF